MLLRSLKKRWTGLDLGPPMLSHSWRQCHHDAMIVLVSWALYGTIAWSKCSSQYYPQSTEQSSSIRINSTTRMGDSMAAHQIPNPFSLTPHTSQPYAAAIQPHWSWSHHSDCEFFFLLSWLMSPQSWVNSRPMGHALRHRKSSLVGKRSQRVPCFCCN